jgi:hypothetical protein
MKEIGYQNAETTNDAYYQMVGNQPDVSKSLSFPSYLLSIQLKDEIYSRIIRQKIHFIYLHNHLIIYLGNTSWRHPNIYQNEAGKEQ